MAQQLEKVPLSYYTESIKSLKIVYHDVDTLINTMEEEEAFNFQCLPKSALAKICANFETLDDVLSFSSTSSVLRDASSQSSVWRTLCERRWGPTALHTHLFTPPQQEWCDYKALFLGVNGWRISPSRAINWNSGFPCHYRKRAPPSTAAAIRCSPAISVGNLQACAISHDYIISMVEFSSPREREQRYRRKEQGEEEYSDNKNENYQTPSASITISSATIVSSYQTQRMPFHITSARPCSIKCLDYSNGIVACGDVRGSLHIVHLPPPCTEKNLKTENGEEDEDEDEEIEADAFIAPPNQQYPITCFEYHRTSSRLFCLWDRGECGAWRPHENGIVRIFDVAEQQLVSSLKEILDSYELCTILCPISSSSTSTSPSTTSGSGDFSSADIEDTLDGGNELIAGTVKISQDRWADGACPRCHVTIPASLCWHQHRSSNAALAFFDLRAGEAPGRMVNRHPLPHRSLYPRLQIARDHYLMVSHAGAPLVIWDRRFLDGGPVDSPQLVLDNYSLRSSTMKNNNSKNSGGGGGSGEKERIVIPERVSNALYLSYYGNMLAGRADNGEIGVWDLSNILGWWNKNNNNSGDGGGCGAEFSGSEDRFGGLSSDMARLDLEPDSENSGGELSSWKRPVLSSYVPMALPMTTAEEGGDGGGDGGDFDGMVVRPRAEVWIGPDWVAAPGQGRLHYFHL